MTEPVTDTGTQLLVSKSNYQCIVEGEHARLGYYPDDYIQRVVSKHASHSVAERARRERLNTALQKLAEVLAEALGEDPFSRVDCSVNEDHDQGLPRESFEERVWTARSNTKVKIVEMAIEYISIQNKTVREMKERLEDCRRQMVNKRD